MTCNCESPGNYVMSQTMDFLGCFTVSVASASRLMSSQIRSFWARQADQLEWRLVAEQEDAAISDVPLNQLLSLSISIIFAWRAAKWTEVGDTSFIHCEQLMY